MDGDGSGREQNVSKRRQRHDNDDGGPTKTKRSRVSRACDQCRLSRDKCDGKHACQTCITTGRDCSYTTSPKKRGIQPGYIRTLECALALVFQHNPSSQKHLCSQLGSRGQLRQSVKDGSHSDELHAGWTSSNVCKQIDALLSGSPDALDDSVDDVQDASPEAQTGPVSQDQQMPESTVQQLPARQNAYPNTTRDPMVVATTTDLPTNFWAIMDHYYAFTHNWLPISEKNDILKTAYLYPLQGPVPLESSAAHAELWAIIALTSRQMGVTTTRCREYASIANTYIPKERGSFAKGHVAALVVLSLLPLGEGHFSAAWLTIGFAVRILLFLNLHGTNDPSSRRLTLGCATVEGIISAHLNLPVHLTPTKGVRLDRMPGDEDGLEEWAPWQPPSAHASPGRKTATMREPGRCLSTFGALADVLVPRQTGVPQDNTSQPTPQQLHLGIIKAWMAFKRARVSYLDYTSQVATLLQRFANCGGTFSIPPTIAPVLRDIQAQGPLTGLAEDMLKKWSPGSESALFKVGEVAKQKSAPIASPVTSSVHDQSSTGRFSNPATNTMIAPQAWSTTGPASAYVSQRSFSFGQQPRPSFARQHSHSYDTQQSMLNAAGMAPDTSIAQGYQYDDQQAMLDLGDINNNKAVNQETPSDGGIMNSEYDAIFEEIAQANANHQLNDSQFMQNLGLGPESDLRAFFGPDYQESNPLQAYLPFDPSGANAQ